nr:AbiH family protein [Paraprevotella clara]
MNRIILIGNGFDLAHGLPTRYEDFINWYWEKRVDSFTGNITSISEDCLCSIKITSDNYNRCWNVFAFYLPKYFNKPSGKEIIDCIANDSKSFEFSLSPFFKSICTSIEVKGWVDIEKEYYDLLRNSIINPDNCDYTISELNKQLHYTQELLAQYLSSITTDNIKCNKEIQRQIYGNIRKDDVSISQLQVYYDYVDYLIQQDDAYQQLLCRYGYESSDRHFMTEDIKQLRKQFIGSSEIEEIYLKDLIIPENIMLLNFNYTEVADKYGGLKVAAINHIHGDLNNPNSIIFGYGDELDEDYKDFLKQSDNECLRNIKSIKYLESGKYRNLLQFIESAPYQVYIMGHSCGNSDRTLLNTLFEHKNCVSIKPYYYQKDDGSDNYLEIAQNICRNFTDMKLMRDRVVNKMFCEPLPQFCYGKEYRNTK